jgi:anti-sigma-K factor RskA
MSDEHQSRWSDDVAAYALGALEPQEARELEAHLEGCEHCQQELRWLSPAVQVLPEVVERQQPPKRVRDRVMTEVRADAKREAAASAGATRRPSWFSRLGAGAYGWRPAAGLAAIALVIVALVGYEVGSSDGTGSGGGESTVVPQESGVVATMTPKGEGGVLELANVEELPEDRVLEAWVQRDGEVEAVPALFVPNHEGKASTMIEDMDGVEVVMVTKEPKGGSETPTSTPIVNLEVG